MPNLKVPARRAGGAAATGGTRATARALLSAAGLAARAAGDV
jgi:hypothetical protein